MNEENVWLLRKHVFFLKILFYDGTESQCSYNLFMVKSLVVKF